MTPRSRRPIIDPTLKPAQQCLTDLKAAGYTQTQIALATGIDHPRITKWLQGQESRATRDLYALMLLLAHVAPMVLMDMFRHALGAPLDIPARGAVGRPKKGTTGGKSKKVRSTKPKMG